MLTLQMRAHRSLKLSASSLRGPHLTLLGASLLILGGCSTVEAECPYRTASVAQSASDTVTLPDGCRLAGATGLSVQRVNCADGRVGFAFQ